MTRYITRSSHADKRLTGRAGVAQRKRIRKHDDCCKACGVAVRVGQVDHVIPLDKGGSDEDSLGFPGRSDVGNARRGDSKPGKGKP